MRIILDKSAVIDLKAWFSEYVESFSSDDKEVQQNIALKKGHTKRVFNEISKIGTQLGLNEEEMNLAGTIALFHDVGRFEQYSRYRTFMDSRSEDHAELGIKILDQHNVLKNLDAETGELIRCAIRFHNKPSLPVGKTETCLFFTKLLRDADKLDIWRTITGYYYRKNGKRNDSLTLDLPDTPGISAEVYEDLMNSRIVNLKSVRNLNDLKLLQTGWIFDINFSPTLEYLKKYRYLEKIRDVMPESEEIDKIFRHILFCRDNK
ncbi:MAG: HD domain-containing protein [Bacteroidales bacterium]|nr:HD domain-containing protein [Bacteroidales bacterium]